MQYSRCSICIKASRRQGKVNFLQFSNNIKLRATSRPEGCQCDDINKVLEEEDMLNDSGISLNDLEFASLRCNCDDCFSAGKENVVSNFNSNIISNTDGGEEEADYEEEQFFICTGCGDEDCYLNKKRTFSTATRLSTYTADTHVQEETKGMSDDWKFYSVVGNSIIGNHNKCYFNEVRRDTLSDLIDALEANVARMKLLANHS